MRHEDEALRHTSAEDLDDAAPAFPEQTEAAGTAPPHRSVIDDVEALISDARTYVDAEMSFQKSRVAFIGSSVGRAAAFGAGAAIIALVAAIAIAVGLVIALAPLVTAWGATAIVGGALLLTAYLLVRTAAKTWREMTVTLGEKGDET